MDGGTQLIRYDAACRALAEAKTVDEAKDLRDTAEAMRAYARQAKNRQLEVDAAEIRIRAERRLGELIVAQKETVGLNPGTRPSREHGGTMQEPPSHVPTLAEAGIDKKLSSKAQKLAAVPEDKFEGMLGEWRERVGKENERVTTNLLKEGEKAQRAEAKAATPPDLPPVSDRYHLMLADMETADVGAETVDCIITDPPYPKQFIPCYTALAIKAMEWLKPGGSLLAMAGQSHLPEVLAAMTGEGLNYQWTVAYLTPGGQAVQIFPRKVNTFWKPVFWFVKGEYQGDWIGDVAKSNVNDNDKRFHNWGQSESGMADLISRFTYPGHLICDPFMGGGTTGAVALAMNRLFVGIEKDAEAFAKAKARIGEAERATVVG